MGRGGRALKTTLAIATEELVRFLELWEIDREDRTKTRRIHIAGPGERAMELIEREAEEDGRNK